MQNKKTIMAFSAMQIMIFHLWVYIFMGNELEIFLRQTAFVGVDIFFFLSAFSLGSREITGYTSFMAGRFKAVYLKFLIFAVVAYIYKGWSLGYFFQVITGIDLIKKGGGAFLWFLPAIMVFYAIFPLIQRCDRKNRIVTFLTMIGIWLVVGLVLTVQKKCGHIFIFWNRIPIFMLGYYCAASKKVRALFGKGDNGIEHNKASNCKERRGNTVSINTIRVIVGIILTVIGLVMAYFSAFKLRLQVPIKDMFYITVIPVSVGLVLLVGMIPEIKAIQVIGAATLEIYAVQMIFGYDIANKVLMISENSGITNLVTIFVVVAVSVALQSLYKVAMNICNHR